MDTKFELLNYTQNHFPKPTNPYIFKLKIKKKTQEKSHQFAFLGVLMVPLELAPNHRCHHVLEFIENVVVHEVNEMIHDHKSMTQDGQSRTLKPKRGDAGHRATY